MLRSIFILLSLCLLFSGCDNFSVKQKDNRQTISRTPIKGALLAQVNDWSIGTVDFNDKLNALKTLLPQEELQDQFNDAETKKKILQELVNFEILAQEAESKGMDKEPEVVDAVKNFKRNFLAQKMLGDLYKDITITNLEIENFYNTNKDIFKEPEEVRVREIAVSSETQAKDLLIRLLQGESFASLARTYSVAPSRSKDGDLGYLKIDQETVANEKFPTFWKTVINTEEGKSSSYFQSPDNKFYIIRVEDVKGGKPKSLTEVREAIREHLKSLQANQKKEDMTYNARKKFKVIINEDLIN
ncbi:MAG: peptidyl-prolyl cis-trans isomerase [Candidatus Omnitrophota bacterium]|jgi:peptidyl-prolyl cis-trans isomerase C